MSITKAHRARWHQKRYFQRTCRYGLNRACPTNGSDRGSLRDHNLTLLVLTLLVRDSTEALVGSVDNESIIPGARELRYQAVVALWSCIEVLLKDQIILLLNIYPKLSHRLLNDEQTKKKFELPKLTYEDLVERGFDFRTCMGEMILHSRDGSDLNTLKAAVKVLFGVDDLYKSLDTECIRMLNLQRHLIVHRRGIVDSKYVKQSGVTTPIDAPIDVQPSEIVTNFNQVAELGKHAIISFQKLLSELEADESVK